MEYKNLQVKNIGLIENRENPHKVFAMAIEIWKQNWQGVAVSFNLLFTPITIRKKKPRVISFWSIWK